MTRRKTGPEKVSGLELGCDMAKAGVKRLMSGCAAGVQGEWQLEGAPRPDNKQDTQGNHQKTRGTRDVTLL